MHKNTLIQCNIKIILAISRHLAPLPARRGAFGIMNWKKVLSCRRIFTIHSIYSFNYLHYGKRTGKAIEGRAGRPRQKDERSASGQRDERADGRVQHREHGSGRSAQSLSFDSRTVLGTFFENLRNQYGRRPTWVEVSSGSVPKNSTISSTPSSKSAKARIRTAPWPRRSPTTNSTTRGVSPSSLTVISSRNGNFRGIRFRR